MMNHSKVENLGYRAVDTRRSLPISLPLGRFTDLPLPSLPHLYQAGLAEKKTGAGRKLRKERKNVSKLDISNLERWVFSSMEPRFLNISSFPFSLSLCSSNPTASKEGPWNQEEVCWRCQQEEVNYSLQCNFKIFLFRLQFLSSVPLPSFLFHFCFISVSSV